MADEELLAYYTRRVPEYERVYQRPERQTDLACVRAWLRGALAGHSILEVACGTGYWTTELASAAARIVATDASPEALALASKKPYPPELVRFELADAYALAQVPGTFTAAFAGFWWSHVPRQRHGAFLRGLNRRLGAGATVVFLDNRYVEGSSSLISRRDEAGNTYQRRRLADGSEHEVLKNFPTPAELDSALSAGADALSITEFQYYWGARYRVGSTTPTWSLSGAT